MARLIGIDVHGGMGGSLFAPGAINLNIDLHYDGPESLDATCVRLQDMPVSTAAFGDGSLLAIFMQYLPQLLALLIQFGVIKPKDAPNGVEAFGDGKLLEILLQYLPQILDLLLKFGVIKPKDAAALQFGDGELLKKWLPILLQLLPLLMLFLGKKEDPTDIGGQP